MWIQDVAKNRSKFMIRGEYGEQTAKVAIFSVEYGERSECGEFVEKKSPLRITELYG